MTIRGFMELEIGGRGQFQRDFAATKLVAVLIFGIFCPRGIVRGLVEAPSNSWECADRQHILHMDGAAKKLRWNRD